MTQIEYKQIDDDQKELFNDYMRYAFSPVDGVTEYDPEEIRRPVGHKRGLFPKSGGDPVSICRHYWLDVSIRGEYYPAAGLTSVITPPEHRRNGYISRILEESLTEYHEKGRHLSLLWPFDYGFYNGFGWETANERRCYEGPMAALRFASDSFDESGSYRRVDFDDLATLESVYEMHTAEHSLAIDRDADWWYHRVGKTRGIGGGQDKKPFVYAWFRDGVPRGYLVYTFEQGEESRNGRAGTMDVHEYRYVDKEALMALLAFCYNHDSQADRFRIVGPDISVLYDMFTSPDDITCRLQTGPMARIVDVAKLLSELSYPERDTQLTIEVADEFCQWNDGVFSLSVSATGATCEQTSSDTVPEVELSIEALTQLVVGHRSAYELYQSSRLTTDSDMVLDVLDGLFPSTTAYLPHRF